jgi:Na+-translocating ferredoxin:NAD+ oxidoreductase RnfA subunit
MPVGRNVPKCLFLAIAKIRYLFYFGKGIGLIIVSNPSFLAESPFLALQNGDSAFLRAALYSFGHAVTFALKLFLNDTHAESSIAEPKEKLCGEGRRFLFFASLHTTPLPRRVSLSGFADWGLCVFEGSVLYSFGHAVTFALKLFLNDTHAESSIAEPKERLCGEGRRFLFFASLHTTPLPRRVSLSGFAEWGLCVFEDRTL